MGFQLAFIGPGGLNSFLPGGWGIRPPKILPGGFARGGWSGLELTDTLHRKVYRPHSVCFKVIP